MDWIEQLFGLSPDGGDGTAEAVIVLCACVAVAALIWWRVPRVNAAVKTLLGRTQQT
jgi:hypothetical protein